MIKWWILGRTRKTTRATSRPPLRNELLHRSKYNRNLPKLQHGACQMPLRSLQRHETCNKDRQPLMHSISTHIPDTLPLGKAGPLVQLLTVANALRRLRLWRVA